MGKSSRRRAHATPPPPASPDSVLTRSTGHQPTLDRDRDRDRKLYVREQQVVSRGLLLQRGATLARDAANEPAMLEQLLRLVEQRAPVLFGTPPDSVDDQDCFVLGTFGCSLLGLPDAFLCWPRPLRQQAEAVLSDYITSAVSGTLIARPRMFVILRQHQVSYLVTEISPMGRSVWGKLSERTAQWRPSGAPGALEFNLAGDLREGGAITVGGAGGTLRIPGTADLVTTLVPSDSWARAGHKGSVARLVDPEGPTDGPTVILTPTQAMAALGVQERGLCAMLQRQGDRIDAM